ncbi:MAG: polysaccharide deacetylase family protein [Alphaproteobacteria bacterium]
MCDWSALGTELDLWGAVGRTATLWWRDDDAGPEDRALARLLELGARLGVPLAVAAVPAALAAATAARLREADGVDVLQHGYAHRNHARPGERKNEFGDHRPLEDMLGEIKAGRTRLTERLGGLALPVFVPPWNRMSDQLLVGFGPAGLTGLSALGPRPRAIPVDGPKQVNVHVDLVAWRNGRRFVGTAAALEATIGHLRARREGREDRVDPEEPTGLLTHHMVQDEAAWAYVARFIETTRDHPAVRWVSARDAFGLP